ncbi:MAG TPA: DUF47 family protein [Syntrophomonadaceae bacterium]|nr:DUF47 family protein [Syntrophomonadaceae bacterium]
MALFGRKDEDLFQLFSDSAGMVVQAGDIVKELVDDYQDLEGRLEQLTEMEHEADLIIQALIRKLHSSFILPFDREDAFQLANRLANTLDYITGIVDRMILYQPGPPNQRVREMVDVLYEALLLQEQAFNYLDKVDHNKKKIFDCCNKIRILERKQDNLYRSGLVDLFENEKDPIEIIKWREIYEHIEMAVDHVQEVADVIRNICVKYS